MGVELDDDWTGADLYRDLKACHKTRRQNNTDKAAESFEQVVSLVHGVIRNDGHTWHLVLHGNTLMYYPPSGKWAYNKRMYHGGIKSFIGWLKNQH